MTAPVWCTRDAARRLARIEVHLQPNARSTGVAGEHGQALKIRVAAPPLDQRANAMLLQFLAEKLGVAGSRLRIVRGEKSRSKLVEIAEADDRLIERIARLSAAQ